MSYMRSNQTTYFGPGTREYVTAGSVRKGETVTLIFLDGDWSFIEYDVSGSSEKKRAYVRNASVYMTEDVPIITPGCSTRYVNTTGDTYTGPASRGFAVAGSLSRGDQVTYLGIKTDNYAYVEYVVQNSEKKKRAYVLADHLSYDIPVDESLGLVVGERPPGMEIDGPAYRSAINMYYPQFVGECTWYCWGRTYEKMGKKLSFRGPNNGGQWYDNVNTANVTRRPASAGPVNNSLCSCSGNTRAGHVIFVELVQDGYVYYTEANTGTPAGIVKRARISEFPVNRRAYGYIVL